MKYKFDCNLTIGALLAPSNTLYPLRTIFTQGQIQISTNPNDHKTVTQLSAGARENRPINIYPLHK